MSDKKKKNDKFDISPHKSESPKQKKKNREETSASSNPTEHSTAKEPPTSATKPKGQIDSNSNTPPNQPSDCPKKDVKSTSKDVSGATPPGEPSTVKAGAMAPSAGAEPAKPSTPESKTDFQPETDDLKEFGESILEALNMLGGKDAAQAQTEYQKLIQQQKQILAEISREKIRDWQKNNDLKNNDCHGDNLREESDPLRKSLKEICKKDPQKGKEAIAEYQRIKSFVETFGKAHGKHVTQVDVAKKPQTPPKEQKYTQHPKGYNGNGNGKERRATPDEKPSCNESDKTSTDGQRGDKQHSGIVIPDGYTLISCKELETMQYELQNQRESIEELTSRLSAIASNRLKEGNPNIADLSDKNRPTKLGECFASLYDDEWSEALEEMGKGDDKAKEGKETVSSNVNKEDEETDDGEDEVESKSIQKLLDVVKLAYKFCGDEATAQLHKIAMGMKGAVGLAPSVKDSTAPDKKSNPPTKPENKTETKTVKPGPRTGAGSPSPNRTAGSPNNATNLQATGKAVKPHEKGTTMPSKLTKAVDGKPGLQGSPTPTGTKGAVDKDEKANEEAKRVETETWSIALRSAQSFRKETALNVVPQVKQLFKDFYIKEMKLESAASLPEALGKYIDRCVELTWLMSVQDPPMEIKWVDNGARSDTNYFKFYQSKGKMVKQCVWPAVFLSAQGGIVSKGAIIGMAPPKDT